MDYTAGYAQNLAVRGMNNAEMRTIAMFGASGMLGKPVARALAGAGFQVRALARRPERARADLPASIKWIIGDLRSPDDVASALEGVEGVYLNLSIAPPSRERDFQPEREGLRQVLEAAKKSGVRRIAYLSSIVHWHEGFEWWGFHIKREAVRAIKQSGIPYLIFYPSNFMETLPEKMLVGRRLILAGQPRYKNYWIAGEDYARQVARAFQTTPPGESREFVIQGKTPLDMEEAAALFQRYYSRKIKVVKIPIGLLRFMGRFSPLLDYGWRLSEAINEYPETFEGEAAWRDLGEPLISLEAFARGAR
jgi:uncharacterized protein YbjT (DUF2867 family)